MKRLLLVIIFCFIIGPLAQSYANDEWYKTKRYGVTLGFQKLVYYDEWLSYNYFRNTGLRPTAFLVETERTNSKHFFVFNGIYHVLKPHNGLQPQYRFDKTYFFLIDINYSYLHRLKGFCDENKKIFVGGKASTNGFISLRDYQYNGISGASISHELKPFELGAAVFAEYNFKKGHTLKLSAYAPLLFVKFKTYVPLTLAAERNTAIKCIGQENGIAATISYLIPQESNVVEIFYQGYLRNYTETYFKRLMINTFGIYLFLNRERNKKHKINLQV